MTVAMRDDVVKTLQVYGFEFKSELGKGTTFSVFLAKSEPGNPPGKSTTEDQALEAAYSTCSARISVSFSECLLSRYTTYPFNAMGS